MFATTAAPAMAALATRVVAPEWSASGGPWVSAAEVDDGLGGIDTSPSVAGPAFPTLVQRQLS
jgi:hypothetical protein